MYVISPKKHFKKTEEYAREVISEAIKPLLYFVRSKHPREPCTIYSTSFLEATPFATHQEPLLWWYYVSFSVWRLINNNCSIDIFFTQQVKAIRPFFVSGINRDCYYSCGTAVRH